MWVEESHHQTKRTVDVVSPSATTATTSLPTPPNCLLPPSWLSDGRWRRRRTRTLKNRRPNTHTHNTIAHTRWERKREAIFIPCECVRALLLHPLVDSSIGSTSQPPSYCDGGADVVRRLGSLPFSWLSPWWWLSALFFFYNSTNFLVSYPF
jgi:hypothetical protein